jgi:branched-chain amino acid aminotransferase
MHNPLQGIQKEIEEREGVGKVEMEGSIDQAVIYIDGKFYSKEEAKISPYDHGFLYGDGVFEGIRAYGGKVFMLNEHVKRLYESAQSINLGIPMGPDELKRVILEAFKRQRAPDSYIRVVVSRGVGDLGLDPRRCPKPCVVVIVEPLKPLYDKPVKAIVASVRRNAITALNPNIKSLNYLNNILAKIEANKAGVDEAIMLDQRGFVAEGTGENLFIVKNGKLITPPPTAGILVGITRGLIIKLAREEGIKVEERDITVHEVYTADEAFLTGTAAEIAPLVELDGRKIGGGEPGPVTLRLREKFKELTIKSGTAPP